MTIVFPAWRINLEAKTEDPETGQLTEWHSAGGFFHIEQSAEDFIIDKLGRRFGISSFFWMNMTRDPDVWAVVLFTEIIKDSDAMLSARAELRQDIRFAAYGDVHPGMKNPPLGAMVIRRAEALSAAATRHEVFSKAWEALKSFAPHKNWLAIVDL